MKKFAFLLILLSLSACGTSQNIMYLPQNPTNQISQVRSNAVKQDFKFSNIHDLNMKITGINNPMVDIKVKYSVDYPNRETLDRDLSFVYDLKNKKVVEGYLYNNRRQVPSSDTELFQEAGAILKLNIKL